MDKITQTDILIIGQGLAGSCLGYQLHKKGINFLNIDRNHEKSSSMVAAGLINPVVFKRLTKSWLADDLMPYLDVLYPEMEELLGASFYQKRKLLRVMSSAEEMNNWHAKKGGSFEQFLGGIIDSSIENIPLTKGTKLGVVYGASLDMPHLLLAWRKWLQTNNKLIVADLNYDNIQQNEEIIEISVDGQMIQAKKVIFCEGALAVNNPFFNDLPFNLSKGDVLTLKNADYSSESVFNNGNFYLPKQDGTIKMGSTYVWDDLTYDTKKEGRDLLLHKVNNSLTGESSLQEHQVGIRPTVKDRRPFLGENQQNRGIYIFNGLGTKGAMLAPYFSKMMTDYLVGISDLPDEVNINRFNN